jgi:hypothetical protein
MKKYPIVCICGSSRFRAVIQEAVRRETMNGAIVLSPGVFGHSGDPITSEEKEMLDDMHLEKIAMSDEVLVVNPGGYIGESTRAEICRARLIGKPIRYTEAGYG